MEGNEWGPKKANFGRARKTEVGEKYEKWPWGWRGEALCSTDVGSKKGDSYSGQGEEQRFAKYA